MNPRPDRHHPTDADIRAAFARRAAARHAPGLHDRIDTAVSSTVQTGRAVAPGGRFQHVPHVMAAATFVTTALFVGNVVFGQHVADRGSGGELGRSASPAAMATVTGAGSAPTGHLASRPATDAEALRADSSRRQSLGTRGLPAHRADDAAEATAAALAYREAAYDPIEADDVNDGPDINDGSDANDPVEPDDINDAPDPSGATAAAASAPGERPSSLRPAR